MKQSEMKALMRDYPHDPMPPQVYTLIKCKNKKYSDQGCTSCWYCPACGRRGCDNLIYVRWGIDTVRHEDCNLEEG